MSVDYCVGDLFNPFQLRKCKDWIKLQYSATDDEVKEWIEEALRLNQSRLLTSTEQEVDYVAYLRSTDTDTDSGSDEEDTQAEVDKTERVLTTVQAEQSTGSEDASMIVFSDDDDDGPSPTAHSVAGMAAPQSKVVPAIVNSADKTLVAASCLKPVLTAAKNSKKKCLSERDLLKQSLQRKVVAAAGANLCKQMKISATKLSLKTEVSEKCRYGAL
jgi:hypothetical protein